VKLDVAQSPGFWLMAGQMFACVGVTSSPGGDCWGDPEQLSEVPGLFLQQVEGTYMFAAGIDESGAMQYWGLNGDLDYLTVNPDGHPFASFDLESDHACAVTDQGAVRCWGHNSFGQASPPDSDDFVQVAVSDRDSCGLRNDGTIVCWGLAEQEGLSFPADTYRQLSGGEDCFCALKYFSGEIECISHDNSFGEATPPEGSDFRAVATGGNHSCAIKTDNSIVCWGFDTYGESTPPDRAFAMVSVGQWSTCGLDLAGGIYCWGLAVGSVPPEFGGDAFEDFVPLFL
jgi:hypothetical protein